MKFFLDTANLDELKKGASWGMDGVRPKDWAKAFQDTPAPVAG